ncbi:hypothetical protein BDP27DRAFT_1455302 [Rhodocollybia butyracea]|uniref:Uncharacterized protein n=1 Tax=Rhodocollybia butyracea TaxID=206335 RepID=A0A9P5P618_9AGAR|nr:hypothetical protein BDP27DRAFT_1455302 [Rhodocollybia butyracea]
MELGRKKVENGREFGELKRSRRDNEEVVKNFVDVVESHGFVFVRLMGLAGARGWVTARANPSEGVLGGTIAPPPPTEPTFESLSSTLLKTSTHLQTIRPFRPTHIHCTI